MEIINTTLHVGATAPFRAIHLSDTHLTYADERDGARKVALVDWRRPSFKAAEQVLAESGRLADELDVPILHTGDLLDFVSVANLEAARAFTDAHDVYMAAGNHEFSLYVGKAKEDAAYRNQSLDAVQSAFKNNIRMDSRVINGVTLVALDNGYYTFERAQFDFLKQQVARGLPVVLMMHVPFYTPAFYERMMSYVPCAYLVGVPEEKMSCYPPDRYEQQLPDALTLEMMAYIANEPSIKAILTGHNHFDYQSTFADRIPQLTTGSTTERVIEFV